METVQLTVEGMTCDHCVRAVERAVRSVAGVRDAKVEVGSVQVTYDPGAARVDRIVEAVEDEGYVAYRKEA